MIPQLHHYYLARFTLETTTPLSIATGGGDGVFDVTLVRDANGLPTLPGSAIAGVLRHLYWELKSDPLDESCGKNAMRDLFGYQDKDQGGTSQLQVSWGCIQDSTGKPVEGLLLNGTTDELLKSAVATRETPTTRDRVRLNHRGAATHQGKFDRAVLIAGHRFSAEIALWSDKPNDPRWSQILGLLRHPLFRLGGGTRSGLGRLKLHRAYDGYFNLQTPEGRKAFSQLSPNIGETKGLKFLPETAPPHQSQGRFITATLTLNPRGFWYIGQGEPRPETRDDPADILPKLEPCVVWKETKGSIGPMQLLVPATAIKGALSHRVAFHANRQAGRWADEPSLTADQEYSKESCPEVQELFGFIKDDKGQVGRVLINDSFIKFESQDFKQMMHNAIDRFTGGVREHMLFREELVWKKAIKAECAIDTRGLTEPARLALRAALDDLCSGRLSLGGGAGKGHGFFTGTVQWSDQGKWIKTPITPPMAASPTIEAN